MTEAANAFSERPWGRYRYEDLESLEALLFPEERKLMAWMALNIYAGVGEIVDAGAFLGGSAACFAHGLNRNNRVSKKDGRIHSFDLYRKFTRAKWSFESWNSKTEDQSTLDIYHDQLSQLEHMVAVYPGDIKKRKWSGGSIEFLMLDCSKTEELNNHCLRIFFPNLAPKTSYIIHQDYALSGGLYWLHTTMHLLKDYFEHVTTVKFGGTTVFRCIKNITPKIIEDVIAKQNLEPEAIMRGAVEHALSLGDEKVANAIKKLIKNASRNNPTHSNSCFLFLVKHWRNSTMTLVKCIYRQNLPDLDYQKRPTQPDWLQSRRKGRWTVTVQNNFCHL